MKTGWRRHPHALAMLCLAWTLSCGDEDPPTAPPSSNRPPAARGTMPALVIKPGATTTSDAGTYFTDPDGHPLTFSSSTSDAEVATVSVVGSTVTVAGERPGAATITVTARDPAGLAAVQTFAVTVEPLSDREILSLLYQATGGPRWFGSEHWLSDAPLGDWFGVEADGEGRVVGLRLYRNNLEGAIPKELAGLASLSHLQLASNHLSGAIPPELGELSSLSHLGLFNNHLEGPVPPQLGHLSKLTRLELDRNPLTGPIPRSFLGLGRLTHFYFGETLGLCVPGTSAFSSWIETMAGRREGPFCNQADMAALTALFEAAGGESWTTAEGWLGSATTAEWHGVAADSLGRVTSLDLTDNGLTGRIPRNLGDLAVLTGLRIGGNALSGRLPVSLARLPLRELRYADTGLCVPMEPSFRAWLDSIPEHEGTGAECGPRSDRDVLAELYDATGGPGWNEDENWLSDEPLGEWHGVDTDNTGRVTGLRLPANGLSGPIPREMGELGELTELVLWDNDLSGSMPAELGNLANLNSLVLWNNGLTGAIPPELGNLSRLDVLVLGGNQLSGPIPGELGNLTQLRSLILDGNALEGSVPPELGSLANLESLSLALNHVTGAIPSELGNLSSLTNLNLRNNALTGAIPSELGNLARLSNLNLSGNQLSGSIPAELGNLDNLFYLMLAGNSLTGPIPPEIGNLARVSYLNFSGNGLTGSIPPRLGGLANAFHLELANNELAGPIPPELGELANLRRLFVDRNALSGPVPVDLARIENLRHLGLAHNPGLSGALPGSLTQLTRMEVLVAGGTGLCAPSGDAFSQWLESIPKRRVISCAESGPASAYLTQAVQSRAFPVPLVAGEPALLRVFVTAARPGGATMPAVRARFFLDGAEAHVADIASSASVIPAAMDEGDLTASANAEIPREVVRPGLEMVVEIDPGGTLDPAVGITRRIPAAGRAEVDVREMPVLDLTLIPFLFEPAPDSSILELTAAMAADPHGHELLRHTRTLLPVGDIAVTAHEPVLASTNDAFSLLGATGAIRAMEGRTGHYMGMIGGRATSARGVAHVPGRISFSVPDGRIIAHELGHNLSLRHAPCGGAGGPDPSFPEPDGSIGAWGYDFRGGRLVRPGKRDLMSYCEPPWISDFYFTNALRFRLSDDEEPRATAAAAPAEAILLWGGVDAEDEPFLEPAFVLNAPASLPRPGAEYAITGRDAEGLELFSFGFDMPRLADGGGGSFFAFMLPARREWAGRLASIALSGPGGSDTMDRNTDRPVAIVRDPRTGRIRGILRLQPPVGQAAREAPGHAAEPGMEILLSMGIPGPETWRR